MFVGETVVESLIKMKIQTDGNDLENIGNILPTISGNIIMLSVLGDVTML